MRFYFVLFDFYEIIIERFSLFDDGFGCLFPFAGFVFVDSVMSIYDYLFVICFNRSALEFIFIFLFCLISTAFCN